MGGITKGSLAFFAAILASLALGSQAQAVQLGVGNFFGNPSAESGFAGNEFSATAGGIATNDTTGDVYVADTANNRIQRFDSEGNFISTWGADVIPGGASGTGNITNGSKEVTGVVPTSKAFLIGQLISGANIPAGTRIASVTNAFPSKLTLTKAATKTQSGEALTAAAGVGNVAQNEKRLVTLTATGGNFKLTLEAIQGFANATTENIPYNASPNLGPESVQARLEALPSIGAGNVAVTSPNPGGVSEVPGGPYTIEFKGKLADTRIPGMTSAAGSPNLSGGTITRTTLLEGGKAVELCTVAAECKAGVQSSAGIADPIAPGGMLNSPSGIAVGQSSGNLYVTNQGLQRIEEFSPAGAFIRAFGINVVQSGKPGDNPPASAKQTLTVSATAGKYTLEFQGQQSGELAAGPSGATAAQVQSALNALSSVSNGGFGSVTVSGPTGGPYEIVFGGALANNPEPEILAASAPGDPLSGGTASVATTTPGSNGYEICQNAADCQRSVGSVVEASALGGFANTIGYPAVAPVGAPNEGNVLVADPFNRRIQEFTSEGAPVRAFGFDATAAGPGNTGTGFEICSAAGFDVCQRATSGSAAGQFVEGGLNRVAEDSAGNMYTVEGQSNYRLQKFTAAGEGLTPSIFNPGIGGAETLGGTFAGRPTDVAADPTNDHLYVVRAFEAGKGTPPAASAERRILEFDSSATLVETHLAGYGVSSVNGLALKAGGGKAYLTSSTPKAGVIVLDPPVPPSVTVAASSGVSAHGATLNGTVNPNGGGGAGIQHTTYRFEYSADGGSTWTKATPTDTDVGTGEANVPVSQGVSGLQASKDYLVRIVATKGGLATASTPGGAFKTLPDAPLAQTLNAWWDGNSAELVLKARVNPQNEPTTYFFQYGTEDCSSNPCASFPASEDAFAGEAGKDLIVSETITGLDTSTGYHYRVVAANPSGTVFGADEEIGPGPSSAPCPNQVLREENDSTELPECRAYELVSNANSKGIGTASIRGISDDGERVMIEAQTLGEPVSLVSQNTPFPAKRTATGWEIPRYGPPPTGGFGYGNSFGNAPFSAALDVVVWGQSTASEYQAGEVNWIRAHSDGSNELVAHLVPLTKIGGSSKAPFQFLGGAPDLSTIVFQRNFDSPGVAATYVPGEPLVASHLANGVNLYRAAGAGTPLALVNRDATGTPITNVCGVRLGGLPSFTNDDPKGLSARPISRDGSVIYFNARPGAATTGGSSNCDKSIFKARVFKRIGDSETVEVSKSQCTRTVPTPCNVVDGSPINGDDVFQGASADGQSVLISSTRQLTDSDEDAAKDLYLYDASPPAGQPTLIQVSAGEANADHPKAGSGAEVQGVVESSADGSRTYFAAKGRLTAAATQGANNLYLFQRDDAHPTGRLVFIAVLPAADSSLWSGDFRQAHVMPYYGSGGAGAGDGHLLFFVTAAKLAVEDTDSAADLYRYDDEAEALSCISCQGGGAFDVSIANNENGNIGRSKPEYVQEGRVASEDGAAAVFTTEEPLLPGDENSAIDVYEWNEGTLSLISGGAGTAGSASGGGRSTVALISPDAKRIVFQTKAKLYPADENTSLDVYAASVDGGFPLPPDPVSKCEDGQACRGPAPAPPPTSAPASAGVSGSGNVPPKAPKGCKGGKVKRKGRCVNRKPKKKASKHHSKRAHNHKRGGNR